MTTRISAVYHVKTNDWRGERYYVDRDLSKRAGRTVMHVTSENGRSYKVLGYFNSQQHRLELHTTPGFVKFDEQIMEWDGLEHFLDPEPQIGSRIVARPVDENGKNVPADNAYGFMVTSPIVDIEGKKVKCEIRKLEK